jgi:hypothetical protein
VNGAPDFFSNISTKIEIQTFEKGMFDVFKKLHDSGMDDEYIKAMTKDMMVKSNGIVMDRLIDAMFNKWKGLKP